MRKHLLGAAFGLSALALASSGHADDAIAVDLLAVETAAELEALKRSAGTAWWLEVGEVLLLAGDIPTLRDSVPRALVLREFTGIKPDRLAIRARGCGDHQQRLAADDLILSADTFDLVNRPLSFSPLTEAAQPINPHLGIPEFEPVAKNSRIARLHRFDRPEGVLPPDPTIVPIVARVDGQRWFQTVSTLTEWDRSSYSTELPVARQWVADQFSALGLAISQPTFTVPFAPPQPLANVIGRIEGSELPDEWVIVGAHLDSRNENNNAAGAANTPGADDNASGCAGVIEAARALAPYPPRRTVLFICYSGEEQGLYGSLRHVDALVASGDINKVTAMFNLDMIGWINPSPGTLGMHMCTRTDQAGANATALLNLLADAAATYAPELTVTTSTSSCGGSDQVHYLNRGRPATHSIHRGGTSYPHYHRTTDTPANLGVHAVPVGGGIVRANVAAVAQAAGYSAANDLLFADDFENSAR